MNVLLVEDDLDLAGTVAKWLAADSYRVEVVSSGKAAQERLTLNDYDVVILDWDLPEIDGLELCRRFRASGGTAPVLITTGRKLIGEKGQGFEAGADDYITKPYELEELTMRIKALIRRVAQKPQLHKIASQGSLIGTVLAERYEIISELGSGGMGAVYLARHTSLGRSYALKILHAAQLASDLNIKRFEREARAASALSHPNLITVYDYGFTALGQPFLVMDYLEGQGLDQLLEKVETLSRDQFVSIFSQVCDGLSHAHNKGIVHRDLKPSNIMLLPGEKEGELVKVVDFGIAKLITQTETIPQITQTGEFFGSPLYMSPEQSQSLDLDARSDIYSLGCVMYEAVTGMKPMVGEGVLQTILKHLSERPKSLAAVRPDLNLPESLERLIFKALEKSPAERYQSAAELKAEIQKLG